VARLSTGYSIIRGEGIDVPVEEVLELRRNRVMGGAEPAVLLHWITIFPASDTS